MKDKLSAKDRVMPLFKSGATLMVGGFLGRGTPMMLIEWLIESGADDLHLIATDVNTPDVGIGKLISAGRVRKLTTSHIGTNPQAGEFMREGKLQIEFVPQGTLGERIRAGGAGLGGVLVSAGLGTEFEEGKTKIDIDGKTYLVEKPIKAGLALIGGSIGDRFGNIVYLGITRNLNPIMATAANTVVAEVDKLVETGDISPERVITPGVYVDYVVTTGKER